MDKFNLFKAMSILSSSTFGIDMTNPIDKGILGHDMILKLLDIKNNRNKYGLLYRNDIQLSDHIFRVGGMSSGFNGKPYTMLIDYGVITSKLKDCNNIKSSGYHCIIDVNGVIVLRDKEQFMSSLYYLEGCIAKDKEFYYNLKTGNIITRGNANIKSKDFLFVEHTYSFYSKEDGDKYPIGVYKIDWNTGEYEYFK